VRVHGLLQSPAWSRAWLAVLDDLPAPADDELANRRVSVGAWADHHHEAGGRVGAAGRGLLSGSERDRSATWRLVRRGLAHDAKVRQVSAGLLLLDRLSKGRAEASIKSYACPSATWKT
jgi:hypothetical protein